MSLQSRGTWITIAAFTGMVVLAEYGWVREHDARLQAETQTAQQDKQISGLKEQQQETQSTLVARLAALEREKKQPITASQFADDTKQLLPALPAALQVRSLPDNPALPDGPKSQVVVVPQEDITVLRDAQISCEENAARLTACESTQSNLRQEMKLTAAERDEWKATAKGGSFWHRTLGAAKWFAVGAGTGAAAYAIAHHK